MYPAFLNVFAFSAAAAAAAAALPASASELTADERWGCEVLLCLSNPAGPAAEPACRDPMERLYGSLRSRHPHFPKCPASGGYSAASVYEPYDDCPLIGLEDAPEGLIEEGTRTGGTLRVTRPAAFNTAGVPDGNGFSSKACVKGRAGVHSWTVFDSEGRPEMRRAEVFETVKWLEEMPGRAIDLRGPGGRLLGRYRY